MTNKTTKRALLMSVLSMLLCVTMLIGTTFAWFTDSVSSTNNLIVAGNLDVNLYWSVDGQTWTPVDANTNVFKTETLWEPGHTEVVYLKVKNEGTLALNYDLTVNIASEVSGTNVDGNTFKLSDYILYNVYEGINTYADSAAARGDETGDKLNVFYNKADQLLEQGDEAVLTMVVFMPTTVGNEANYLTGTTAPSINLGINLFATQKTHENDSFGSNYDENAYTPVDNAGFKDAITANEKEILVVLSEDVVYDVAAWANDAMGGAITETIIINGNGHTITFNQTNSDWNNIVTQGAKLIINNAHITNSGYNNGPWNRHDLNFACDVELNNVTSDKALAFKAGAVLNNVTISDANTSDTYAIWIQPNGQTVTLNGCTIDMLACTDGRGIKIDEQYVDAPAKVTLNVSNTTFKTEEKAAILVKSVAGADITLSNVNIANTVDPIHAVWVDEDSAAYADLVTVSGGSKFNEGDVVSSSTGLNAALSNGETDIVLGSGNFSMPSTSSDVTISGTKDTVIDLGKTGVDNVTFNGVTVNSTGYYGGLINNDTVIFNDCIIDGTIYLYGEKVVFNNCTFDLEDTNDYIWVYGTKNAEFNNCTFNTMGKAILVFQDGSSVAQTVKVEGCTFNATKAAYNYSGTIHISAVSMDGSQGGTYNVILNNNIVDSDFNGLWQDKTAAGNITVTVDGVTVLNP